VSQQRKPLEEGGWVGRFARWAAEPYLAFKDDQLRLYALIARDLRKVAIVALVLYFGHYVPWRAWISLLN
jgi:hypothetical protein